MRIKFLDSLRGLAILMVIFYHSYARWVDIVPYKNAYADFPVFKFGWLGVQLFFLISGFVIFMTLDKTESFKSFLYKRWLRLFPAMLIASLLIFTTSSFFAERPAGMPYLIYFLPGLTFIEPSWWSQLFSLPIRSLEGTFWSLYVEFKFYLIAGAAYYFLGRKYLIKIIFLLFIIAVAALIAVKMTSFNLNLVVRLTTALSTINFGWFASGALFYEYYLSKNKKYLYFALFSAGLSAFVVKDQISLSMIISAFLVAVLFAVSILSEKVQMLLENRALMFVGFISYPLYLIHENALISMIIKSSVIFPYMHSFAYPILPFVILSTVAYVIAKYLEPWLRNAIKNKINSKPYVSS